MDSVFSANEPSLGYLYQVRYGLFLIILEDNHDAKLLIERLDDISIETPTSLDVYQTKLHIKSIANLTDASPDLWKTIRIWCEGIIGGLYDLESCLFHLITTAVTSEDTIPYKLKQGTAETRNAEEIQALLKLITETSTNATNKYGYTAFNALSGEQQLKFIKRISVVDASINLNEAKSGIIKFLNFSTIQDRVMALYERLEGWYINEVILQLQHQRNEISKKEVMDKIHDISDTLKVDNLPDDFTVSIASDEGQLSPYRKKVFVKNLEDIRATSGLINHAISDYHRAYSQKSKWLREGLINPNDEGNYNEKLIEDWERKFAILEDYLASDDAIKSKAGRDFYINHYVKTFPSIYIKDRFREQYMVSGSCQMLSDKNKMGWHPNFLIDK